MATAADQAGRDPAFVLVAGRPSLDLVATSGGATQRPVERIRDPAALARRSSPGPAPRLTTRRIATDTAVTSTNDIATRHPHDGAPVDVRHPVAVGEA